MKDKRRLLAALLAGDIENREAFTGLVKEAVTGIIIGWTNEKGVTTLRSSNPRLDGQQMPAEVFRRDIKPRYENWAVEITPADLKSDMPD